MAELVEIKKILQDLVQDVRRNQRDIILRLQVRRLKFIHTQIFVLVDHRRKDSGLWWRSCNGS